MIRRYNNFCIGYNIDFALYKSNDFVYKKKIKFVLSQMDLLSYAGSAADEIINLVKNMKEDITEMIQRLKLAQETVRFSYCY